MQREYGSRHTVLIYNNSSSSSIPPLPFPQKLGSAPGEDHPNNRGEDGKSREETEDIKLDSMAYTN